MMLEEMTDIRTDALAAGELAVAVYEGDGLRLVDANDAARRMLPGELFGMPMAEILTTAIYAGCLAAARRVWATGRSADLAVGQALVTFDRVAGPRGPDRLVVALRCRVPMRELPDAAAMRSEMALPAA